jgi:hypothetical protein
MRQQRRLVETASRDHKRSIKDQGVFGVEFMCFPLCRKGSKLTLLRPIRLHDLCSQEKKDLQMWVEFKDDTWLSKAFAKPKGPSAVLAELQIEDKKDFTSPMLSDRIKDDTGTRIVQRRPEPSSIPFENHGVHSSMA